MNTESQPRRLKKFWISDHPRLVIAVILLAGLGPFLNKAIHVDDPLFLWTGQWIQRHPIDFFGFNVNWWASTLPMWKANYNPPVMSYFLAGVASLLGWHEIVLHLACLVVAFMAAVGIYSLARMWCERPLLATVVAIFTPVFLVCSTTLMCDVLMMTFWVWALVLWERALVSEKCWWQFAGAGVLAGLAVLTKYSAVTLLPLLPVLALVRTRKAGWWLLGLAIPLMMVAGYELITAQIYGKGLLAAASHFARTVRGVDYWKNARGITGLAFAGGSLLPLLLFAPLLWRRWVWLAGGFVILGVWLGTFDLWNNLVRSSVADISMLRRSGFALQAVLLSMGGLQLLLLVAADVFRRRDISSVILALWIFSGLFFATVLNWTVSARSFLPLVPAAAILLVRRLTAARGTAVTRGRLWPLIPAAAIALSLAITDYQLANSARSAAEHIMAKYKTANRTVWFEGHWGLQYYMEKLGARPIDVERSALAPGDIVVVPWNNYEVFPLPAGSVALVEVLEYGSVSWMNVSGSTENQAAGFYSTTFGPLPFTIGKLPLQKYDVVKVFARTQFQSQPTNPREVQAGDVPRFSAVSSAVDDQTAFQGTLEAEIRQAQPGIQLEQDGKLQEAIRYYRESLRAEPNDPIVLNNLAWILAASGKPGLRNGKEAACLAERACQLTQYREASLVDTLAAAYAEAGRFDDAVTTAQKAHDLARTEGMDKIATRTEQLQELYKSGRAYHQGDKIGP